MTTRNLSEEARRREEELQRRTREAGGSGWEVGPDGEPRRIVDTEDDPYDRLMREAPTADDLTPDLFLEDPNAVPMPESMAGSAEADLWTQAATSDALDLLMRQVDDDASGRIQAGTRAQMQMADLGAAGAQRRAGDAADAQAYGSGTQGSGMALQAELGGLGDVNDALLHNYVSVYTNDQGQALDTLANLGAESGALRGQTFGEAFQRGAAVDAFNQHNLGFLRDVNTRNTDRRSRQSAEREGAHQQTEDNEYSLHMGAAPIRQAEGAIADQMADDDQTEGEMAYNAVIGTAKNILG